MILSTILVFVRKMAAPDLYNLVIEINSLFNLFQ